MKENELRIGNLVTDEFYGSFKTIIKVESINDKGINLAIEDDGNYPECASRWIEPYYKFNELYGIPLTEEILLKCGFEKLTTKSEGYNASSYSYRRGSSLIVCLYDGILSVSFWQGNEKKYLHELQNFFFTLTGEELEITL